MEALRAHIMTRFLSSTTIGEEVTGILFGTRDSASIYIHGWSAIHRERPELPAVPLAAGDEEAFRKMRSEPPAQMAAFETVGWFRSRTRGMAALSPEDRVACQNIFPEARCLAIIFRPSTQRPVTAAFFTVGQGAGEESSQRGVRVAMAPGAVPARERGAESTAPSEIPQKTLDSPGRTHRWLRPTLAFAAGLILSTIACYFLLDRQPRLDVHVAGKRVLVEWNRTVGFLTRATGAELRIARQQFRLTQSQLRRGSWIADAPTGDFTVTFVVAGGLMGPQRAGLVFLYPVTKSTN